VQGTEGNQAMECMQCGSLMMPETVIKLRRGFAGFHETRSCGAYCPTCKIGVPMESHQSGTHRPVSIIAYAIETIRTLLPTRRHAAVSQSPVSRTASRPLGDPFTLTR
jgi:hypothetical protein